MIGGPNYHEVARAALNLDGSGTPADAPGGGCWSFPLKNKTSAEKYGWGNQNWPHEFAELARNLLATRMQDWRGTGHELAELTAKILDQEHEIFGVCAVALADSYNELIILQSPADGRRPSRRDLDSDSEALLPSCSPFPLTNKPQPFFKNAGRKIKILSSTLHRVPFMESKFIGLSW